MDEIKWINQRKLCSKKLCKYATIFNYLNKFLNITIRGIYIVSYVSVVGIRFAFAIEITKNKILMLAKSKH